ncbi:MAG: hypothetical protein CBC13_11905 [Planctomycetia bacterium TMED53]|nr:MAG: hypothetical protein CBC13_11905 [Planctomycetia bacterium TMED53]
MIRKLPFFLVLALLASFANPIIEASKAPYSPEQLFASSEIIVVGEILSMEKAMMASDANSGIYLWQVRMSVSKVEKGALSATEIITTFNTTDGSTMILCGPSQFPIPSTGDQVKAHLEASAKLEDGTTVYPVLAPNGYAILQKTANSGEVVDNTPLWIQLWRTIRPLLPVLLIGGILFGWFRMQKRKRSEP